MTRTEFLKTDHLQSLNLKHIAELGVYKGSYSADLHNAFPNAKLSLVDIWDGKSSTGDKDGLNMDHCDNMEILYYDLQEKYHANDKINLQRKDAVQFLKQQKKLCMIYIDDIHTYEAVKERIDIAYNKLHCKVIAGHDYSPQWKGVIEAVDEFYNKHKDEYTLHLTDDKLPSFYLIKNTL